MKQANTNAKATGHSSNPKKSTTTKRVNLPPWVSVYVWTRAGGRCEFPGCNEPLWKDLYTTHEFNRGKIAHIIAARKDGPRGHSTDSPRLVKDPSNLLLLCGTHHDLVDNKKHVVTYPVDVLRKYKETHETRIERLGAIAEKRKTVPVVMQAPIFKHADPIPVGDIRSAIAARGRYPDDQRQIEINLLGMSARDHDQAFWNEALLKITTTYDARVATVRGTGPADHFSIFATGPIPLLVAFGRHVGDKIAADVYNLHRNPKGWIWPQDGGRIGAFEILLPRRKTRNSDVALALSISSEVQREHFRRTIPTGTPVYEIRARRPILDNLRHPRDLQKFAGAVREVMEAIHRTGAARVHVFAAIPMAAAVEFGRALLPKLHSSLELYDFHSANGGWRKAFALGGRQSN